MSKDLKNMIDGIESSEKETAQLQSKINRLQELLEKQKTVISEQENLLEEQKVKISRMYDIPEDVLELKELIGTQRALLNEKETELELAKGEVIQYQKELELMNKQNLPTQKKLEETFDVLGNLKAELAEKNSEILMKNERIKNLESKVNETQAFADKLQDEQVKLLTEMDQKLKVEVEAMRKAHFEEKKELTAKIAELDNFLLDSKLVSTEATSEAKDLKSRFQEIRDKQEALIKKIEDLSDEKRLAQEEVRKLNSQLEDLRKFREDNFKKIIFYDKLIPLMEQENQFKAFLIVEKVGSISVDDLRNALGAPIVLVKKIVQNLQDYGLFEINEQGKISVINFEVDQIEQEPKNL
jgi:chromosome segregation ATPase